SNAPGVFRQLSQLGFEIPGAGDQQQPSGFTEEGNYCLQPLRLFQPSDVQVILSTGLGGFGRRRRRWDKVRQHCRLDAERGMQELMADKLARSQEPGDMADRIAQQAAGSPTLRRSCLGERAPET